jgi:hypothetical protein
LILKSIPFWITWRCYVTKVTHYSYVKILASANFSTIIKTAILADSEESALLMTNSTREKTLFLASYCPSESFEIARSASTPSAWTCSSEFINIFEINGKTWNSKTPYASSLCDYDTWN